MSSKPEIEFPTGPAPAQLVSQDLVVGDGPEAVPGGTVEVHYDPANPSNAALENPTRLHWLLLGVALAFFALAAWAGGLI